MKWFEEFEVMTRLSFMSDFILSNEEMFKRFVNEKLNSSNPKYFEGSGLDEYKRVRGMI